MKSQLFSLKWKDAAKGLVIAVGTSVAVIIQNTIAAGSLTFDWKNIGIAAIGAAVTYLLKNYLTDDVKVAQKTIYEAKEEAQKDAFKNN